MCLCIDKSSEFFNEIEDGRRGCLLLLKVSNVIIAASVNHIDVFIGIISTTFFEFQSTIILIKKIARYHFVILEHLIFFLNYT